MKQSSIEAMDRLDEYMTTQSKAAFVAESGGLGYNKPIMTDKGAIPNKPATRSDYESAVRKSNFIRTALTSIGMTYKERNPQYMSSDFFGAIRESVEARENKANIDNSAEARRERLEALVAPLPVGSTSGAGVGPVSNPPDIGTAPGALPGDMAQSSRNTQIARFANLAASLNYAVVERPITDDQGREVAGRTQGDQIKINPSTGRGEAGVTLRYHELGHGSDQRAWPNQNNLPGTLAERLSAPQYKQYNSMLANQLSGVRLVVYGGAAAANGNELGEQTADAIGMYLKNPIQFTRLAPDLAAVVQSHLTRFQPQLLQAAGIESSEGAYEAAQRGFAAPGGSGDFGVPAVAPGQASDPLRPMLIPGLGPELMGMSPTGVVTPGSHRVSAGDAVLRAMQVGAGQNFKTAKLTAGQSYLTMKMQGDIRPGFEGTDSFEELNKKLGASAKLLGELNPHLERLTKVSKEGAQDFAEVQHTIGVIRAELKSAQGLAPVSWGKGLDRKIPEDEEFRTKADAQQRALKEADKTLSAFEGRVRYADAEAGLYELETGLEGRKGGGGGGATGGRGGGGAPAATQPLSVAAQTLAAELGAYRTAPALVGAGAATGQAAAGVAGDTWLGIGMGGAASAGIAGTSAGIGAPATPLTTLAIGATGAFAAGSTVYMVGDLVRSAVASIMRSMP